MLEICKHTHTDMFILIGEHVVPFYSRGWIFSKAFLRLVTVRLRDYGKARFEVMYHAGREGGMVSPVKCACA